MTVANLGMFHDAAEPVDSSGEREKGAYRSGTRAYRHPCTPATESVRVLLVEDDSGYADLVRSVLEEPSTPFDITHATLLHEALQLLNQAPFDVVLLDLSLPDSSDLFTLSTMRAERPDVPIIVLTAYEDDTLLARTLRKGAQNYIPKGELLDPSLLEEAICYAIQCKRAEEIVQRAQPRVEAAGTPQALEGELRAIIRDVCDATAWVYGEAWVPCNGEEVLERNPAWHAAIDGMDEFEMMSRPFKFPLGEELPGRAWSLQRPVWVPDVVHEVDFRRRWAAADLGLGTALAVPLLSNDEVLAVLVFMAPVTRTGAQEP